MRCPLVNMPDSFSPLTEQLHHAISLSELCWAQADSGETQCSHGEAPDDGDIQPAGVPNGEDPQPSLGPLYVLMRTWSSWVRFTYYSISWVPKWILPACLKSSNICPRKFHTIEQVNTVKHGQCVRLPTR